MGERIKNLLLASPFLPFAVISMGGNRYHVASADHAGFNPSGNLLNIWFDDDGGTMIATRHIAAVEMEKLAETR